jgi:prepilin-type N-terminal cleavage/methylation domain-containing protein
MRITGKREVQNRREAGGGSVLTTFYLKPSTKRSAFTLIEMIGVMALIAILAAVVVPPLIRTLEEGQKVNEDAVLEEIARALLEGIEREARFPNPTLAATNSGGWVGLGSKYSVLGTNKFWSVFPKQANDTFRRVYMDASLISYLGTNYSMPPSGWTNTNPPASPLIYIVSSSRPDLQLACPTNANLSQTDLDWLKNWVKGYETGGRIPAANLNIVGSISGTTNRWTNRGEFLHVKILNVGSLLCEVRLEDWHSPITNSPSWQSGGNETSNVSQIFYNNVGLSFSNSAWFISGQPSRNFQANFTDSSGGGEFRTARINYTNTSGQTNRWVEVTLPFSSRFSLATNSIVSLCDFSSANNPNRRDSTNFFVLKGTSIRLFDNTSSANLQTSFTIKKTKNTWVFRSGAWDETSD